MRRGHPHRAGAARAATTLPLRHIVAWGALAAVAWVALAAWSGAMSPMARRPLLDGLIPGAVYRWAAPPEDLAATNVPPSAGTMTLVLERGETAADVFFTADNQLTLVAPAGVVAGEDLEEVRIEVTPEDPASFAPLPGELAAFGNVYRIEATAGGRGDDITSFDRPLTAILVYPATPNLHATEHEIRWSSDGTSWEQLDTQDAPAQQQATAELPGSGLVVVAGVPQQVVPSTPDDGGTGRNALSTALLVIAGASLLIGIGLLVRARGQDT